MARRVEGHGKVHCYCYTSPRGTPLLESKDKLLGKGQKCNGGRALRPEAVQSVCKVHVLSDKADRQLLKKHRRWA